MENMYITARKHILYGFKAVKYTKQIKIVAVG